MPVQKGKSGLAAKAGKKLLEAHAEHQADETDFGFSGGLPAGIEGGIAQLTECKFGIFEKGDNEGEYYYLAMGVVKSPKSLRDKDGNVLQIAGSHTKVGPIPICDTTNRDGEVTPLAKHWARILNELRKFGVDTKKFKAEDAESVAEALKQAAPHFKFRTWQGKPTDKYPDPRVNEDWKGIIENYVEGQTGGGGEVEDNTGNAADFNPGAEEVSTEVADSGSEGTDLDALAARADNVEGGEDAADAQREISAMCAAANIDSGPMANWTEAIEALKAAGSSGAAKPGKVEKPFEPEVKNVLFYLPKGKKKAVEVEVTHVFKDKQTVNLRDLSDGKTAYKAVPWAELKQG